MGKCALGPSRAILAPMGRWGVLVVAMGAASCLDTAGYGPHGYHCESDADCDSPAFCFRNLCELAAAEPVKPTATNTGVPPGTSLQFSGGLVIDKEGTVLDG